ncbi:hypothetical protein V1L54_03135 [Streptomyces sp. TRM 70361]|uniref:hypothetical protein n=1 Tax=Streptomyces sp. TRM 70361 TaxID=3116553 RepID=UPI002E7C4ABD|nr:hypothetical protein [Streptomyces sp. TRM 70361]MEE1938416.1 hypothetical protein [Streptomyces sp. TRM 70361]
MSGGNAVGDARDARGNARGETVPYVVAWSGERCVSPDVVATPYGLAYVGEVPQDRDRHGVLWSRTEQAPGRGRPEFGRIHPARQRRAMLRLLCQICARPASRTADGVLWVIEDDRGAWDGWPERAVTTHPPLCLPCARQSVARCPHLLKEGWVAVRVRHSAVEGVYGRLWHSRGGRLYRGGKEVVFHGRPEAPWVVAGQLTRTLHGCTPAALPLP